MKKIVLYIFILIGICFLPVQRQDVADLEPVQAVRLSVAPRGIQIETDTGDIGTGKTVVQALQNMKQHSKRIIYLDTAQYLLVTGDTQQYAEQLCAFLKNSVRVCIWNGEGKLADAAQYAKAHKIGERLDKCHQETRLPIIPEQLD